MNPFRGLGERHRVSGRFVSPRRHVNSPTANALSFTTSWLVLLACLCTLPQTLLAKTQTNTLGPVSVAVTLSPDELTIGDEVTLEVRVEAEPDVEVLMPEFGEALQRYRIVDFVPSENIQADGRSEYTQRYTLQPSLSGAQSIPPILVEFIDHRDGHAAAPDDADAYEILTDRLDFEVASVLPENAASDLKPPLGELAVQQPISAARKWSLLGLLIGLVAAAALAVWYRRRTRRQTLRVNAYQIARQQLDRELGKPQPQSDAEVDAYFVALSRIVRRYLEDRFELRAPDLTTEEFLELAGSASDLTRAHQSLLRDFLRQADLVKFAGMQASPDDIAQAGRLASQFLDETRENAPDIEIQMQETA